MEMTLPGVVELTNDSERCVDLRNWPSEALSNLFGFLLMVFGVDSSRAMKYVAPLDSGGFNDVDR